MMDRARVLLVAAPDAPVRVLEDRLQDPDLLIVPCTTAKAALDQLSLGMPDAIIVDASMPGAHVFRLYGRLRGSAAGLGVPIIFTNHTGAELGAQTATVPDYYLGPEVDIGDVEQLLFTFLPESLVEIEEPDLPDPLPRYLSFRDVSGYARGTGPACSAWPLPPAVDGPGGVAPEHARCATVAG